MLNSAIAHARHFLHLRLEHQVHSCRQRTNNQKVKRLVRFQTSRVDMVLELKDQNGKEHCKELEARANRIK